MGFFADRGNEEEETLMSRVPQEASTTLKHHSRQVTIAMLGVGILASATAVLYKVGSSPGQPLDFKIDGVVFEMSQSGPYYSLEGGNCPPGDQIIGMDAIDECLKAAKALGKFLKWRGGAASKAGLRAGHVPAGCWTRLETQSCWKTGACELAMNTYEKGRNNGGYTAICQKQCKEPSCGEYYVPEATTTATTTATPQATIGTWKRWRGGYCTYYYSSRYGEPEGMRINLPAQNNELEECQQRVAAEPRCGNAVTWRPSSNVCQCVTKGFACAQRNSKQGSEIYGKIGVPDGQKLFQAVGVGRCKDHGKHVQELIAYGVTASQCRDHCLEHGYCKGYVFEEVAKEWEQSQIRAAPGYCTLYPHDTDVEFLLSHPNFIAEGSVKYPGFEINSVEYKQGETGVCYRTVIKGQDPSIYQGGVPFPNIELITKGYNLYEGDPLPITSSSDPAGHPEMPSELFSGNVPISVDPGLKKPLFDIDYSQMKLTGDRRHTVPDGYHVTVDEGCATVFTTKKIRDTWQYKTEQTDAVSVTPSATATAYFPPPDKMSKTLKKADITVGVQSSVGTTVGGTMSYQLKDIQDQNRLRDQTMYRSQAKCSAYVAAMSFVDPPKTHPDFQKVVDSATTAEQFHELFDEYGTHMLTLIKTGARAATTAFVSKQKSEDIRKTANGVGMSVMATVGAGVDATIGYKETELSVLGSKAPGVKKEWSAQVLTPPEKTAAEKVSQLIDRTTLSVVGPGIPPPGASVWAELVKHNPVPFEYDTRDICLHPAVVADADKFKLCREATATYCDLHLNKRGANCDVAKEKECYEDMDCEDGFVCRTYQCVELPRCRATVWQNADYKGSKYTMPTVDEVSNFGGAQFDLTNGNVKNNINSIELSDGCLKAELVDDDRNCVLGKGDNLLARASVQSLDSDLRNDVCMIKLWAKPAPLPLPMIDRPGWVDLVGKQVRQSSEASGGSAERAIDQDVSSSWASQSCTCTQDEANAWFELDLGADYQIEAVELWNRADCCGERLHNLQISVDGKVCQASADVEQGTSAEISCIGQGRKVKIMRTVYGALTICEIKVLATCIPGGTCPGVAGQNGAPKPSPFYSLEGGNCPPGEQIIGMDAIDECLKAAKALGKFLKWRGGAASKAGLRVGHVPAGCWTRLETQSCWKTGACELAMNTYEKGRNNGGYTAICKKSGVGSRRLRGASQMFALQNQSGRALTSYSARDVYNGKCDKSFMDFYEDVYLAPRVNTVCWYEQNHQRDPILHEPMNLPECQQTCAFNPHCEVAGFQRCRCQHFKSCFFTQLTDQERYVPDLWLLFPKKQAKERWAKRTFVLAKENHDCPHGILAGSHPAKKSKQDCENTCNMVETCRVFWWDSSDNLCKTLKSCGVPRKIDGKGSLYAIDEERFVKHLPNVGKAMYGYNTFYGAPASVESAGTDPGFQHRPLWDVTYDRKTEAERVTFFDVPGFKTARKAHYAGPFDGFLLPADQLNRETVYTLANAKKECQAKPDCTGLSCDVNGCLLNKGTTLRADPANERVTYVKDQRIQMFRVMTNKKMTILHDHPIYFDIAIAKEACLARKLCTGITCDQEGRCKLGEGIHLTDSAGDMTHAVSGRAVAAQNGGRRLRETTDTTLVPDGWKASYGISAFCDTEFQSEEIKSNFDFDESSSFSLNPLGLAVGIGDFSFSLSHESKEFFSSNSKYKKAMYKTSAECVEYTLEMDGEPPLTSRNFQHAVDSIEDEGDYHQLFQVFGLHYPTSMVFGARYGHTQTIRESSFKELSTKSVSTSISGEVSKSYEKTVKGVTLEGTIAVKADYTKTEETSESREFEDKFEEKKEFSLGKKLPPDGDVAKWAASATGEAMPIRYNLTSICNHPAMAPKKDSCAQYHKSFCHKFLAHADPEVRCEKEERPECLWDIDCLKYHVCSENVCQKEPDCTVYIYPNAYLNGSPKKLGPYYFSDTPQGRLVPMSGNVRSVKISGGCEEVVFFDQDKCKDNYKDNAVLENRDTNLEKSLKTLGSDLNNDICRLKILPKKYWLKKTS